MAYLLVLDLGLDVVDGVAALDLERDGLARQRLDEDLHLASPSLSLGLRPRRVMVVVVLGSRAKAGEPAPLYRGEETQRGGVELVFVSEPGAKGDLT
jgi:hypothetical protein